MGTVDAKGLVTAGNVDAATISASYQGLIASTRLTVTPALVTVVTVNPTTASVTSGLTQRSLATATYSDSTSQDVSLMATWTATDFAPATAVATSDTTGLATGQNVGKSTITASYQGKSGTAELTVAP